MANDTALPGWYYAEGDPVGTQRYWDGAQWSGEPVPLPPSQPNQMVDPWANTPSPVVRGFWENFRFVVVENYANFKGRARRREYWLFTLAHALIGVALFLPTLLLADPEDGIAGLAWIPFGLAIIFVFAMIIPSIAVLVRRLHDSDRTGAWYFVSLIPYVGALIVLVLLTFDGTPGPNQYGPDTKARR